MIITTNALPEYIIVDPIRMLPRFWATVWSLSVEHQGLSPNTRRVRLRHIDRFYVFCDSRNGLDAFDQAVSMRDARKTRELVEAFFLDLTASPSYASTAVQCWDSVRAFVENIAAQRAVGQPDWAALVGALKAMGRLRNPNKGAIRFIRSIPANTLLDLLAVVHPNSGRNPFQTPATKVRNWLIVNLLLYVGLRRGELLLLQCSSLQSDIDLESGDIMYWINVTSSDDEDHRYTLPSMKTSQSHRQVPISEGLADLFETYVSNHRPKVCGHDFLFATPEGAPLSAEAIKKVFSLVSDVLKPELLGLFRKGSGKDKISPHDLRHTCATARYAMFMALDGNRELALQRLRVFFGWSEKSTMPSHYARAAIQEDLMRTWNRIFDQRVDVLREIHA